MNYVPFMHEALQARASGEAYLKVSRAVHSFFEYYIVSDYFLSENHFMKKVISKINAKSSTSSSGGTRLTI